MTTDKLITFTREEIAAAEAFLDNQTRLNHLIQWYPKAGQDIVFISNHNGPYYGIVTYVGFNKLMATVTAGFERLEIMIDMNRIEIGKGDLTIYEGGPGIKIRTCSDQKFV